MKLETAEHVSSFRVTESDLDEAFRDDIERGDYIILSQSKQVYIQARGEFDGPYIMEYREGDDTHHYQCTQEVPKDVVWATFKKYLRNDASWKTAVEWELLDAIGDDGSDFARFASTPDSTLDAQLAAWAGRAELERLCAGDNLLARAVFHVASTNAIEWMSSSIPALGGQTPVDCLMTESGRVRLEECLMQMP